MDVTEIGCRSPAPVTGDVLGTGVIWAVFQTSGTLHCVNEKLTNLATTGPSSTAHVLYIQEGIPSGPWDVDLILPKTVTKKSKLINRNFLSRCVSTELHAYNVTASVIYDLLCVKSRQAKLSVLGAADIESLCLS